jgi:ubiquinone/menaquinone biosynthesis C-methylase UbiE
MADVWATVRSLDHATQQRLAEVLETRGGDAQQQRLRQEFLTAVEFPAGSRVLEVGCGTGVLTRRLARVPGVESVLGVDIAPSLLERARSLVTERNVTFEEGDATALRFSNESFEVVVLDSTLSHVPDAERAIAEAARVLRPAGLLAVFDGNYSTTTVALGDHDPLQACVEAMMTASVTDRWLMRRLPAVVGRHDLTVLRYASHDYVETTEPDYLLTVIDRGADLLHSTGQISDELVAALKSEGRRRVKTGTFFGQISYTSLIARRPSPA